MSYYPNNNFYSNYPYNNPYLSNAAAVAQTPTQPAPSASTLQGKIVDGEEMVKATEVPFGGYGVFPKADLSEIFIKTWNGNGTTQITSYRPYFSSDKTEDSECEECKQHNVHTVLLEKMEHIVIIMEIQKVL